MSDMVAELIDYAKSVDPSVVGSDAQAATAVCWGLLRQIKELKREIARLRGMPNE